jgi:DNA-binding NarL/FixJ family response regulator
MTNNKINIAFIEDHMMVRESIISMLKVIMPNIHIIIEANHGKEFISQLGQTEVLPDIAILDLNMHVMGGIETVKWIKEHHKSIKTLILTQNIEDLSILEILKIGVNGYCEKGMNIIELVKAINIIYEGGEYYPGFVKDVQSNLNNNSSEDYIKGSVSGIYFSEEELKLIELCYQGLMNKEISTKMKMGEKSVENYFHKLYLKTGAKRKSELITYAIKNKLIKLD